MRRGGSSKLGDTVGGAVSGAEADSPGQATWQELVPRYRPSWNVPMLLQQAPKDDLIRKALQEHDEMFLRSNHALGGIIQLAMAIPTLSKD